MKLLSDRSVAERIFKTTSTLSKWRMRGVGPPFVKVGPRGVAYPEDELERWLRANVRSSTSKVVVGRTKDREALEQTRRGTS
ncbi:MAG: hypothetical protein KC643_15825 [Nitrospira sp.]|nr:hypothetical protein [Nitrospira sp.]